MPLYINLTSYDVPKLQQAQIKVTLPQGFEALANHGWQLVDKHGQQAVTTWQLPGNYGQSFDLLYIKPVEELKAGQYKILVEANSDTWQLQREISFSYVPNEKPVLAQGASKANIDKSQYNWYIQSVNLPVDANGNKDDRAAANVIYVRDTTLEGLQFWDPIKSATKIRSLAYEKEFFQAAGSVSALPSAGTCGNEFR